MGNHASTMSYRAPASAIERESDACKRGLRPMARLNARTSDQLRVRVSLVSSRARLWSAFLLSSCIVLKIVRGQ